LRNASTCIVYNGVYTHQKVPLSYQCEINPSYHNKRKIPGVGDSRCTTFHALEIRECSWRSCTYIEIFYPSYQMSNKKCQDFPRFPNRMVVSNFVKRYRRSLMKALLNPAIQVPNVSSSIYIEVRLEDKL
jgi:hypothetical protein